MVRIGLVGLGRFSRDTYIPALQSLDADIVGCDRHLKNRLQAKLKGVESVKSVEDVLAAGVDAVAYVTAPEKMFEPAMDTLAAGIPVYLEKPGGTSSTELAILERLANHKHATCSVGFNRRHIAAIFDVKTPLKANHVLVKDLKKPNHPDWIRYEAIHGVDLILSFHGHRHPERFDANATKSGLEIQYAYGRHGSCSTYEWSREGVEGGREEYLYTDGGEYYPFPTPSCGDYYLIGGFKRQLKAFFDDVREGRSGDVCKAVSTHTFIEKILEEVDA